MEQRAIRNLVLYAECDANGPSAWVLDPPEGRHSFRIVLHCRRVKPLPLSRPSPWSSQVSAVVHTVLSFLPLPLC